MKGTTKRKVFLDKHEVGEAKQKKIVEESEDVDEEVEEETEDIVDEEEEEEDDEDLPLVTRSADLWFESDLLFQYTSSEHVEVGIF